jgi:hypothetical protein
MQNFVVPFSFLVKSKFGCEFCSDQPKPQIPRKYVNINHNPWRRHYLLFSWITCIKWIFKGGVLYLIQVLIPKGWSPWFGPLFEVWASHCRCNICPKNLKFLVNMWFSASFRITNFYKIPILVILLCPKNNFLLS